MYQVSCGNRQPKDNGVLKPQKVNEINKIEFNPTLSFEVAHFSNIHPVIKYCYCYLYINDNNTYSLSKSYSNYRSYKSIDINYRSNSFFE